MPFDQLQKLGVVGPSNDTPPQFNNLPKSPSFLERFLTDAGQPYDSKPDPTKPEIPLQDPSFLGQLADPTNLISGAVSGTVAKAVAPSVIKGANVVAPHVKSFLKNEVGEITDRSLIDKIIKSIPRDERGKVTREDVFSAFNPEPGVKNVYKNWSNIADAHGHEYMKKRGWSESDDILQKMADQYPIVKDLDLLEQTNSSGEYRKAIDKIRELGNKFNTNIGDVPDYRPSFYSGTTLSRSVSPDNTEYIARPLGLVLNAEGRMPHQLVSTAVHEPEHLIDHLLNPTKQYPNVDWQNTPSGLFKDIKEFLGKEGLSDLKNVSDKKLQEYIEKYGKEFKDHEWIQKANDLLNKKTLNQKDIEYASNKYGIRPDLENLVKEKVSPLQILDRRYSNHFEKYPKTAELDMLVDLLNNEEKNSNFFRLKELMDKSMRIKPAEPVDELSLAASPEKIKP